MYIMYYVLYNCILSIPFIFRISVVRELVSEIQKITE